MYKLTIYVILSSIIFNITAQEVSVSVYQDRKPQGITLTVQKGKYLVYEDKTLVDTVEIGANVNIIKESDYLVYRNRGKAFATDKEIRIVNSGESSFFLNYTGSVEPARCYDGWIKIKRADYFVIAINYVPLESYVAAIVEGDGVALSSEEYFKAMAIVMRTLTLFNLGKHANEGFDFCDGSHCYAYRNKATSRTIIMAAKKTANIVMVDKGMSLFNALFHLNSGGLTADGSFVLNTRTETMKPVKDTFAVYGKNYSWKLLIPGVEWQEFLVKKGLKTANSKLIKDLVIKQPNRISAFKIGNDSVRLEHVRDLGWKSSFFDMSLDRSGVITVMGKGTGHGAGLSQESAIAMASKGYTYDKVLNYFYKDIHIVPYNNLKIFAQIEKKLSGDRP